MEAHSRLMPSHFSRGESAFPVTQIKILKCALGHVPILDLITVFRDG